MTSNIVSAVEPSSRTFLQKLYLTRAAVQIAWAILIGIVASSSPRLALILAAIYPLWDVASTIWDLRFNPRPWSKALLLTNIWLGVSAALAVVVFGSLQIRYAVVSFGIWALLAGILQLVVGLRRRRALKGQWAMIFSGAQSALVGAVFSLGGAKQLVHLRDLAGYALFGAVYFLIAAVLLRRNTP